MSRSESIHMETKTEVDDPGLEFLQMPKQTSFLWHLTLDG